MIINALMKTGKQRIPVGGKKVNKTSLSRILTLVVILDSNCLLQLLDKLFHLQGLGSGLGLGLAVHSGLGLWLRYAIKYPKCLGTMVEIRNKVSQMSWHYG